MCEFFLLMRYTICRAQVPWEYHHRLVIMYGAMVLAMHMVVVGQRGPKCRLGHTLGGQRYRYHASHSPLRSH